MENSSPSDRTTSRAVAHPEPRALIAAEGMLTKKGGAQPYRSTVQEGSRKLNAAGCGGKESPHRSSQAVPSPVLLFPSLKLT